MVGRPVRLEEMSADQYFAAQPRVAPAQSSVKLSLADINLKLATDRGVFSYGEVDAGTRFLLQDAGIPIGETMLDLGCGYGPIALTMAKRAPKATIWAVDVNERAIALCARNALDNGCPNVQATLAEGIPDDLRFDTIWSNPPIRIGKAAMHVLLTTWLARLTPSGHALLVVHKHLGADSLVPWLVGQGFVVDRPATRQGYRLLSVRHGEPSREPSGYRVGDPPDGSAHVVHNLDLADTRPNLGRNPAPTSSAKSAPRPRSTDETT
jgi:16S rRNA (guanine1207-N2)-methyltransferase